MKKQRIVLAYSGGLDTSVLIGWLTKEQSKEVIAVCVDVGQRADFKLLTKRAYKAGASKVIVIDAKREFAKKYCFRAIKTNALYESRYPLVSSLSRPLIAEKLVDVAKKESCRQIAHGCTAKGNDQIRFEVAINALAPDIEVLAPVRSWNMTREESLEYAKKLNISLPYTKKKIYSVDENLFGRAIECGELEDPNTEPPEDVWSLTKKKAIANKFVTIGFKEGEPISINDKELPPDELINYLNKVIGPYGYGRIDMVENRKVGIKSREVYEAPAALALILAHQDLEGLTLEKDLAHEKLRLEPKWAELIYDGMWFSPLADAVNAFIDSSQKYVTGQVRLKLEANSVSVVGRKSEQSLYKYELATYDKKDAFSHQDASGFVNLLGLGVKTWAEVQKAAKRV